MKIALLILLASTCCFSYNDLVINLNKKVDSSYVIVNYINFKNYYNRILVVYENKTDVYLVKNHSGNIYQKYKSIIGSNDSTLQQIFICYTDTLLYRISIQLSGKNYLYQYNLSETSGFINLKNDTYTPPNVQIDPMDSASVNRKIRRHNNGDQNSNSIFQQNTAINNNSIYPYADCVVRVLVAYTSKAESQAIIRGYREINDMIHDYITQTNITFENSNINAKIKLAKTMKVNYDDAQNKDIDDILEDFQDEDDGKIDEIHTQRVYYQADICVLLTGLLDDAGGVAESIGANDYDEGFCIVASTNPILTFAHEIGHLFGAEHNISSASPIPFRMYGHGNRFETANGNKYRTVMAYNNSGNEYLKVPYWSNPNINYQGVATGTNQDVVACVAASVFGGVFGHLLACKSSNNARVLNEQFPTLAGLFPFIQNVVVPPQTVNNNNIENITAHNITSNLPYTIESGSEVTFHARDQIRISGNFRAKSGSFFRATRVNFTDCNPQSNTGRFEATESAEHIDKVNATGSRITISPNPTTSKVHLTTGFDGESEIVLTDIAGKTLQTYTTTSNETDIDLSAYSNGMYFFKITNRLGKHIAKVMKIVGN